jgi:signal transduction histidine kinase
VRGGVWGALVVATSGKPLCPPETERRIAQFAELVSTAVANAQARDDLHRLADEQASLRRVATLVAEGVRPAQIFSAVSEEVGRLFATDTAGVVRFEQDPPALVFVGVSKHVEEVIPIGTRWQLDDARASAEVYRTGRSARVDGADWSAVSGPVSPAGRRLGVVSTVASPIIVEGHLWGTATVSSQETLPVDAEQRLQKFAELVATAIANAEAQAELSASRARIIAAADEARRRIERDLHDGAQQQLASVVLKLQTAQNALPVELAELQAELGNATDELSTAVDELRDYARGIHPAVLTNRGLDAALKALARRSVVPVELNVRVDTRLPAAAEAGAYYVVSEALTNAAKHAKASAVAVEVAAVDGVLRVRVRDDGVGGADFGPGSGLVGLQDRVAALGGRISLDSPRGSGTSINVELPLAAEPTPGLPG